jgi:hypothetical protein
MRNGPLTTILLGLLGISAVASLVLCWMYISSARQLRGLQAQITGIQNNRNFVLALAQDALEYGKTHPAIDPILEEAKLKAPKSSAPAATK